MSQEIGIFALFICNSVPNLVIEKTSLCWCKSKFGF